MYAIVDIETTGGGLRTGKITEITIFLYDGETITDSFVSLINPECPIPYFITQFTGINDQMVAHAPRFFEVAKKIIEFTDNRIFVAHNASFDYGFIKKEFNDLGFNFHRKTLCTVKLSRKYFPGYKSYSLGEVCQQLDIDINNRHRASGDARATVALFGKILNAQFKNSPSLF
jgi:DNA polymerase III subunit epsilon